MCKFDEAKELSAKANAKLKEAIAGLGEGKANQVQSVVKSICSDEQAPTKRNQQGGFKVTSDEGKAKIKAAHLRRGNDVNTEESRKRQVSIVTNSPRTKKFKLLPEKTRGEDKAKWFYQITGELGE